MQIKEVIDMLEKLRAEATPGTWHISKLDGQWAAAVSSPVMETIAAELGTIGGGPERPIGDTDFSRQDDAYAITCVNASPILIEEIKRLEQALGDSQKAVAKLLPGTKKPKKKVKPKAKKKAVPRKKRTK
jgi:hypothetical protein